ncbi:ABC transporter substrate-binding protein [Frankia nepalensis]|uniref:ABC transporter substrate-binding protein n=1 Tax=Frankia nepalensis TaxID=1836974 RepID=UPI0027DDDB2F|nr:ABC transporter substrate-binding protein [Frankia nepalensis]
MALVAAVVTTVALTAGCGTAGDSNEASGPPACDAPGFSANEIKIGFVYPDSGHLASALGAALPGFVARIEKQNAAGGIHGRRLVYEWNDDAANAGENLQAVRALVEEKDVFGIVQSTIATSGGAGWLRDRGIPVVGLPAEPLWADRAYPNMFTHAFLYSAGPGVDTFGAFVKARGGTRAAVIGSDVDAVSDQIGQKITDGFRAVGIEVVPTRFVYNPQHTDAVQLGKQLKAAGVDTVLGSTSAVNIGEIMRGLRAANAPVKVFLAPTGYDHQVLADKGAVMAGLYTYLNYKPFESKTPAHDEYLAAVARYTPELQPPDQELALVTYILTDIFLTGLEKAGSCPTRAGFISTLRGLRGYTAGGLMPGEIDFQDDWGQLNTCYTFMRVNEAGTGYEVVKDPAGADQWCGNRLSP